MDEVELKPLLLSNSRAKKLIDVGNTKYYELIKAGRIKRVMVGGRPMPTYKSLEELAQEAE
jgi:hypothetical protein